MMMSACGGLIGFFDKEVEQSSWSMFFYLLPDSCYGDGDGDGGECNHSTKRFAALRCLRCAGLHGP